MTKYLEPSTAEERGQVHLLNAVNEPDPFYFQVMAKTIEQVNTAARMGRWRARIGCSNFDFSLKLLNPFRPSCNTLIAVVLSRRMS